MHIWLWNQTVLIFTAHIQQDIFLWDICAWTFMCEWKHTDNLFQFNLSSGLSGKCAYCTIIDSVRGPLKCFFPFQHSYAKKNGYPVLYNVTLPRIGALKAIVDTLGAPVLDPADGGLANGKCEFIVFHMSWGFWLCHSIWGGWGM